MRAENEPHLASTGALEFRVLGRFEVLRGGHRIEVGVGKQRALLAVLMLRMGEVVSTDRLIDALWEDHAPASAANSVHVYVSRLRRALGPDRLETLSHGYRLALEHDELDLLLFERQLGEGRDLLAADEPAQAADVLRAALA